ncbi:MAG: hypothetical protein J7L26_00700 [Candidatus Aminicenantes bacterium]|nr:hypothetical protein [Candidatus Aminicenantes bacterium]
MRTQVRESVEKDKTKELLSLPNSCQGEIDLKYDHPALRRLLAQGDRLLEQPGVKLIFSGRNRIGVITFPRADGQTVELVIKEFRIVGIDRFKTIFRASKAKRAWDGARHLIAAQIPTPPPVAYLEVKKGFGVEKAWFITERVKEAEEIRELLRLKRGEELKSLLKDLAAFLRGLHRQRIHHRDLSDGNILVEEKRGVRAFYLLDTNRLRKKRKLSSLAAVKSLIRVGVPPSYQRYFLECYFHQSPPPYLWWCWYKIAKVTFNFYLRFKKFIGLRKVAQRLRIQ